MRAWQIRLSTDGRHPMFPTEARLREAVRALVETVGLEAVLFCIVDDHVHVILFCEREVLSWRARSLCRVVRGLAAAPIDPAFIKVVESRRHMERLVGYLLDQTEHHGLPVHPALWSGSCFLDLVGARVLPGLDLRLRQALPRYKDWQICEAVGLRERDLIPVEPEEARVLGASRIVGASSSVLAVDPALSGRSAPVVRARAAAAQLGMAAGLPRADMAWALRRTRRQLLRLEAMAVPPEIATALRVRLSVEQAVSRATAANGGSGRR